MDGLLSSAETCNGLMVRHANAKPVFIIFCVPFAASPMTLGILTITLHLVSVSEFIFCFFCWPVTLVWVNKIPSTLSQFFSQKFLTLAQARKKGRTRSVGFFTKGPPRGSGCTRIFLKISQNVPFFSQKFSKCSIFFSKLQCGKGKGKY